MFLKEAINWLAKPEILISLASFAFFLMFARLKWFAKPMTFAALLGGLAAFLVGSAVGSESFREILLKPDNVPIILLVVFVSFFFWLSMRQAVENDKRLAEGRPVIE